MEIIDGEEKRIKEAVKLLNQGSKLGMK